MTSNLARWLSYGEGMIYVVAGALLGVTAVVIVGSIVLLRRLAPTSSLGTESL